MIEVAEKRERRTEEYLNDGGILFKFAGVH
jgi:hypothetical protein